MHDQLDAIAWDPVPAFCLKWRKPKGLLSGGFRFLFISGVWAWSVPRDELGTSTNTRKISRECFPMYPYLPSREKKGGYFSIQLEDLGYPWSVMDWGGRWVDTSLSVPREGEIISKSLRFCGRERATVNCRVSTPSFGKVICCWFISSPDGLTWYRRVVRRAAGFDQFVLSVEYFQLMHIYWFTESGDFISAGVETVYAL